MQHARWILFVLDAVGIGRAAPQGVGIVTRKEHETVILVRLGSAARDDEALSAFVEHLRCRRQQAIGMWVIVEADTDKGRTEGPRISRHAKGM